jgi:hypothetical protein
MHLVLDTVLCCHPLYCFAAATSSVWVFQINDQQVKWTPPIQNVYRSVTKGWPTIQARSISITVLFGAIRYHEQDLEKSDGRE